LADRNVHSNFSYSTSVSYQDKNQYKADREREEGRQTGKDTWCGVLAQQHINIPQKFNRAGNSRICETRLMTNEIGTKTANNIYKQAGVPQVKCLKLLKCSQKLC